MPLEPGRKLGHYEIVAPLGAGGMGEVYRALDTRLDRTVAIKVLPDQAALSEDLRTRFRREAKAISSLNHPHICILHDVGHDDGVDYLVMELLEGESLADRLQKGPLPTAETLKIAIQIADALDAAHRQGLVHRDLKPGNVMLTPGGAKVLDFGLAKVARPAVDAGGATISGSATHSAPLTMDGTILGTIQYMAPEALEGEEADARADIFAFGALLFEMITGRKAFAGKSQASLIASILKETPVRVTELQPLAPPMLEQVIDQCLAKEPDQRWQTAGDLRRALQWIVDGGSQAGVPVTVSKRRKRREWVLIGALGVLAVVGALLGATTWRLMSREVPVVRSNIQLAEGAQLWDLAGGMAELSPDGTRIAYVARDSSGDDPQLWVRALDSLTGLPLPGTEWAMFPFWSPDSRHIAFFADGKLKKILATGGPALTLCEAPFGRGGSWNADGVIIFTPTAGDLVHRVPSAGGTPEAVTVRDTTETDYTHRWAHFLPDGEHFLYFARTGDENGSDRDAICLGSLDGSPGKRLVRARSNATYADGRVLFTREGTLMAMPFDAGSGEILGEAIPIAEQVSTMANWSRSLFSTAPGGLLVYREGQVVVGSQLEIMSLDGGPKGRVGPPVVQYSPSVSPDGRRIAVDIEDVASGNVDVWIWDLQRSIKNRLTFDAAIDRIPVWSPDGSLIAFDSARKSGRGIYVKSADGVGDVRQIVAATESTFPRSWSPDGRHLAYTATPDGNGDIFVAATDSSGEVWPFQTTSFDEWQPAFSPDGRWIAFVSEETGREEVYVAPFPGPGGKWQVSNREGDRPRWSGDGKRLYYLDNDDHLNVAEVDGSGDAFVVGAVSQLFELNPQRPGNIYDLFPDGERLLVNHRLGANLLTRLVLVQNWPEELE